jgi:hypothetical protein
MGRRRRPSITADERLHVRLDAYATTAAMAVANRRGDRARAVAELALAAPGRADLAGDVADLWRQTGGRPLDWPPLDTVVRLLDAARRVMLGTVAMVAPAGWRVVQVTVERTASGGPRCGSPSTGSSSPRCARSRSWPATSTSGR